MAHESTCFWNTISPLLLLLLLWRTEIKKRRTLSTDKKEDERMPHHCTGLRIMGLYCRIHILRVLLMTFISRECWCSWFEAKKWESERKGVRVRDQIFKFPLQLKCRWKLFPWIMYSRRIRECQRGGGGERRSGGAGHLMFHFPPWIYYFLANNWCIIETSHSSDAWRAFLHAVPKALAHARTNGFSSRRHGCPDSAKTEDHGWQQKGRSSKATQMNE